MSHRLLVVDDDPLTLTTLVGFLQRSGFRVDSATNAAEAEQKVRSNLKEYALVILDYRLGQESGADVARQLLSVCHEMYVLMYSGDNSRDALKSSWEAGAVGFLEKGGPAAEVLTTIKSWCTKYDETYGCVGMLSNDDDNAAAISSMGLVGRSRSLAAIADKVRRYGNRKENVLVIGETGTGKERIARALHLGDPKKFFAVNCASFSGNADLMESDLFGYTKGAFTGANKDHTGVFEAASNGTVFLDEVHTLDLKAQQKLLRVLQERAVRPLGASREYPVNFRLLAAAIPEIISYVDEGKFLADLFERMNVLTLTVPPLRDRKEDIEPLVAYFCQKYEQETGERRRVLTRAVRYLERYDWPRNVRELENVIRRLCVDSNSESISPEHLDAKFFSTELSGAQVIPVREQLSKALRDQVSETLKSGVSQREAARRLGIPESSLRRMLKKFEIRPQ